MATETPSISPFPWHSLAGVTRASAQANTELGHWFRAAVGSRALAEALGKILAGRVDVRSEPLNESASRILKQSFCSPLRFETLDEHWRFELCLEPALVQLAITRVFGRPSTAVALSAPLDPSLQGALGAIAVEAFRRAGSHAQLFFRPLPNGQSADADTRAQGRAITPLHLQHLVTAQVDDRAYHLTLQATPNTDRPSKVARRDQTLLSNLGELTLEIPLVVAQSQVSRAELAHLMVGDAWMPGSGWLFDPRLGGRGWLAAGRSERGLAIRVEPSGRVTIEPHAGVLPWEVAMNEIESRNPAEAVSDQEGLATSTALEAPVVVRVELGSVALTAREWAALGPGDVLHVGQRILAPAVLRVAGQPVATGELVNVEGELGVRILTLGTPK
ncbi:MAG: FliM/FliN family flagellar motor switch protein [Polyangiaceae bacterium]|nr:FliM/FliN family flagellar motor switch protein [Polyangiaceae bacterium]